MCTLSRQHYLIPHQSYKQSQFVLTSKTTLRVGCQVLKPLRGYASGTILAVSMSLITTPQSLGCSKFLSPFSFWLMMSLPMLFLGDALPLKSVI